MADPIQAALKSTDRAQVLAGVAAALAAPAATVEALLSGITVATWSSRGVHELAWPGAWQCDDARHSLQQEGILRIAAGSSSPRARALVQKLTKLTLLGTDRRWTWGTVTFRSVDLDHVAALPDLRHLDIVNAHGVTFSRALGQVAHLELRDTRLDALPDAPELEHLEIHGGRLPRLDVSRYPKLKHLIVQGVDELRGIDGVAGLELVTVRLAGLAASPDLSGMASLKTIDLSVPAGARVRLAGTNPSELSLAIDAGDPLPDMQGTGLKSLTL